MIDMADKSWIHAQPLTYPNWYRRLVDWLCECVEP